MMDFIINEKYSALSLIQSTDGKTVYTSPNLSIIQTQKIPLVFAVIGVPPSFVYPTFSQRPYFHNPSTFTISFSSEAVHNIGARNNLNSLNETLDPLTAEAFGHDNAQLSNILTTLLASICVFGSHSLSSTLVYLGMGTLSSSGLMSNMWTLSYNLNNMLSKSIWSEFGGYNEWLLVVGKKEYLARSWEEVSLIIQKEWRTNTTIEAIRYEGDCLRAIMTPKQMVCVSYCSSEGQLYYSGTWDEESDIIELDQEDGSFSVFFSTLISKSESLKIIKSFINDRILINLQKLN